MSYQEYAPAPALAPFVRCFWSIERDFQPLNGDLDILPDSCIEVIFNLGSVCTLEHQQKCFPLPDYYLVTLHEKPFRLRASGVLKTIGARFYAWGWLPLLTPKVAIEPPVYRLGSSWEPVFEGIAAAEPAHAIRLLEQFLLNRLYEAGTYVPSGILTALPSLSDQGGFKVAELAQESSLSRRQVERLFRKQAQITPKALSRRMRFEQARNRLCCDPRIELSSLALECGYSDQAHLSREFRHFADRTLSQFIEEICAVHEDLRFGVAFPSRR